HVYVIADAAYKGMSFDSGMSQSVVISGESGAGKTECCKQVLQYLAAIAGSVNSIERKVLKSNPILESFGNAKTVRNNNSSRFGKYVEITFTTDGEMSGATTTEYLLEKVRVVAPMRNERTYHIFYQLCAALEGAQRQRLGLASADQFAFLTKGNCTTVDTIDDRNDFEELVEAFEALDFVNQERDDVFQITAAIMHLGNIGFNAVGAKKCTIKNTTALKKAADLFGVAETDLQNALLARVLRMRGGAERVNVTLGAAEASENRDALAKDVFEQLCINFTNENLQQNFNTNVFKKEEALYQREGIGKTGIAFTDNQEILDLIAKKPVGILRILDEELKLPRGSDQGFMDKAAQQHKSNKFFKKDVRFSKECFLLYHYAGKVMYDTAGFLEKNKDTLTVDLIELMASSNVRLLQTLFPPVNAATSTRKKASLATQFCKQLETLMAALNATACNYIRCVKPNDEKKALKFTPKNCFEQLTYAGVFEAVKIRKLGFPFRLTYKEFAARYCPVVKMPWESDPKGAAQRFIQQMNLPKLNDNVRFGTSMVFYRAEEHKTMELKRSVYVEKINAEKRLTTMMSKDPLRMDPADAEVFFKRFARTVRRALKLKIESPVIQQARQKLEYWAENRPMDPETKRALEEAERSMDEKKLVKAIEMADMHEYANKLYKRVKTLRDAVVEAHDNARDGLKKVDENLLYAALCKAAEVGLQSDLVQQASALYDQISAIHAAEQEASASYDVEQMDAVLARAVAIDLESPQIVNCRFLRNRVARLLEEIAACEDTLADDHMQSIVESADAIGYASESVQRFRELLARGVDVRRQEQMRAAVRTQNVARQIWLSIELKNGVFEKQAALFTLRNYDLIKEASYWASEKLLSMKKDELAAGFLNWSDKDLHASMLDFDEVLKKGGTTMTAKALTKEAKLLFRLVRTYMGDRTDKQSADNSARELLQKCVATPELRDEAYLHIIKQVSRNPNQQSARRGWDLMRLLLRTAPPSTSFENYLEIFLRDNAPSPREPFVVALHQSIYNRERQFSVPAQSEWNAIINSQDASGFTEPLPPGGITWEDLYIPYNDESTDLKLPLHRPPTKQTAPVSSSYAGGGGPRVPAPRAAQQQQPAEEPYWARHLDAASGDYFYENLQTGDVTWDVPPEHLVVSQ
ncbi:MAG: hypothetical protein MHM6MM_004262, partial [Cercozoa sp. M6MM]